MADLSVLKAQVRRLVREATDLRVPDATYHLWHAPDPTSRTLEPVGEHEAVPQGGIVLNVIAIPSGKFLPCENFPAEYDPEDDWIRQHAHLAEIPPEPLRLPQLIDAPENPLPNAEPIAAQTVALEPSKPKPPSDEEMLAILEREREERMIKDIVAKYRAPKPKTRQQLFNEQWAQQWGFV